MDAARKAGASRMVKICSTNGGNVQFGVWLAFMDLPVYPATSTVEMTPLVSETCSLAVIEGKMTYN
jgi:hypothetical protein